MNTSSKIPVTHAMNASFRALLLISALANASTSAPSLPAHGTPRVTQSGKPDGGQGGQKKKKKNEEEREEERARAARTTSTSSSTAV